LIWPATVVGAVAGWTLASIPGALLGALLGHVLDRRLAIESWRELRQRLRGGGALPVVQLQFVLLGRIAKSEGRVTEAHIRRAREEMHRLGLSDEQARQAMEAFSRGKRGQDDLLVPLKCLREQPEIGRRLIASCWRIAGTSGRVGRAQAELIMLWGRWLGLTAAQVEALRPKVESLPREKASRSDGYEDALALLGIGEGSEPEEIKRAYRRQLSRHHPDKLAGAGAGEVEVRQATEQTRRLHAAYELVMRRRGFR
jgi:DnaJ like chaperone protein